MLSPNKVQKINKMQIFNKKCRSSFPLFHSKSGPDPKFLKQFTVWIQSKFNRNRYCPDPVESKSHTHLFNAVHAF